MKAEQVRKAMGPEFCALADELREKFDAKLVYVKAPGLVIGKDPSAGSVRADGKLDEVAERMQYWYGTR